MPEAVRQCSSLCGPGTETCSAGQWGACNAPRPLPPVLDAVIRDFSSLHPDFEANRLGLDPGIVEERLGSDGKPVYAAGPEGTDTTSGADNFDQWYRDVPGINLSRPIELPLTTSEDDPRLFAFQGEPFFPINGELLGNEGRPNNFHSTLEAVAQFDYVGGETFAFSGDDDLWVFVNGALVIDLGGVHSRRSAVVSIDEVAALANITPGNRYSLHLFFAERQTDGSNFRIDTSIATQGECPVP